MYRKSPEAICLEFPPALLKARGTEDRLKIRKSILDMKLLKVRTMVTGIGIAEISPAMFYEVPADIFVLDPVITAIHGGLECGIISSKCPDKDIVSIGPDIPDIHTPNERLDIESASRVYDFLVKYLQDCK